MTTAKKTPSKAPAKKAAPAKKSPIAAKKTVATPAKKAVAKAPVKAVVAAKTPAMVAAKKVVTKPTPKPAIKSIQSFKEKAQAAFNKSMVADKPPEDARVISKVSHKDLLSSVSEQIKKAAKTLPPAPKQQGATLKELVSQGTPIHSPQVSMGTATTSPFKFTK